MNKLMAKIKDNKEVLIGVIIGGIVGTAGVGLCLWLWEKLVAASFNGTHFTDLNKWSVVMVLLALVGVACCIWFVIKFIFWLLNLFL